MIGGRGGREAPLPALHTARVVAVEDGEDLGVDLSALPLDSYREDIAVDDIIHVLTRMKRPAAEISAVASSNSATSQSSDGDAAIGARLRRFEPAKCEA